MVSALVRGGTKIMRTEKGGSVGNALVCLATALGGVTGTLVVAVPSHRSLLDGAAPLAGTQCCGR